VWEYPTLVELQVYCQAHGDAVVAYFHNKGARYDPLGREQDKVTSHDRTGRDVALRDMT
jgi:hypothetical protein